MPTIAPRDMSAATITSYSSSPNNNPKPVAKETAAVEGLRQEDTSVDTASDQTSLKHEAVSPKFAELARREKLYMEKRKAQDAKDAELKSKEAEYQSALGYKDSLKSKFTQAPLEALSELGLSYDQITQLMLNQPKPEDLQYQQLQQEIKALKAANEKTAADMVNQQKQQYEQAVAQIRNEVKMLVDSDASYETVKEMGAQDAVVELIEETFKQKGVLMTVEEASKGVEEYLMEQAWKMANLKKVQAKYKSSAEVAGGVPDVTAKQSVQNPAIKTLTNQVAQSATKPMTAREKRERAILAFQGKL